MMLTDAVLTFSNGKLEVPKEVPKEVQKEMHLTEGTRLRLVSASGAEMRLERADKPAAVDGKEPVWLGYMWYVPNDDWRSLQGILSGHPDHDTSAQRHAERVWELEHDERKFDPFPKRQE